MEDAICKFCKKQGQWFDAHEFEECPNSGECKFYCWCKGNWCETYYGMK